MSYMNFNDIIKASALENYGSDISLEQIALVLGVTAILGVYIFLAYRVAVRNEFYSKDFNITLVLMSVVTAAIVLAIQSNLVISLGMVGALSIIRFRTAVKSPLDLFFLFWSISVGIICGANLFVLAGFMCVIVTVILLVLCIFRAPIRLKLLVLNCKGLDEAEGLYNEVKKYCSFVRVKNKTVSRDCVEVIIEFKSRKETELEKYLFEATGVNKYAVINYDRENRI